MATEIGKELAALQRMTPAQLREKYAAVFGEATVTKNRTWLVRRIAWRLQVLAEGDMSQRARNRATELVRGADLRVIPPRERLLRHSRRVNDEGAGQGGCEVAPVRTGSPSRSRTRPGSSGGLAPLPC